MRVTDKLSVVFPSSAGCTGTWRRFTMLAPRHGRTKDRCWTARRRASTVPLPCGGNILRLDVADDETPEILTARVEHFMDSLIV